MPYTDLQKFLTDLDARKQLKRIKVEVDPILEISAIADRVCKLPAAGDYAPPPTDLVHGGLGGHALLFESVRGSQIPVAINVFGSYQRMCLALGVSNLEELAQRVRKLCDHGREDKYRHDLLGFNYRLDALQAAVLRVKLAHLDEWNDRRRSRAALYDQLLGSVPGVTIPAPAPNRAHVYHLYVIEIGDREGLRRFLTDRRIATGIHYPIALHQQPALRGLARVPDGLPVTERLVGRILSLPMFPEMTDDQVAEVAEAVRAFQTRHPRGRPEAGWGRTEAAPVVALPTA